MQSISAAVESGLNNPGTSCACCLSDRRCSVKITRLVVQVPKHAEALTHSPFALGRPEVRHLCWPMTKPKRRTFVCWESEFDPRIDVENAGPQTSEHDQTAYPMAQCARQGRGVSASRAQRNQETQ